MKRKILFLANHFITLYSFRRELIAQLCEQGHEVVLSLPPDSENVYFENLGCRVVETEIARRSLNPLRDVHLCRFYVQLLRKEQPDIVFSYTIKPNIYGSIASRICHSRQICNITGVGETLSHGRLVSSAVHAFYRVSIRHAYKVFFQNSSDMAYFLKHRLVYEKQAYLIPGSGVNPESFPYTPMPEEDEFRFIYVGRVMGLKGIDQYIQAARMLREERKDVHFYIAGFTEEGHYRDLVLKCSREGIVDYIGFRKDILQWITRCHCTILPSHGGEGIPNVLLESAAAGRACIASRIPGSIDVIDEGRTGFFFEAGDANGLADAIRRFLALTREERIAMGKAGHDRVVSHFDRKRVIAIYMDEVESLDTGTNRL